MAKASYFVLVLYGYLCVSSQQVYSSMLLIPPPLNTHTQAHTSDVKSVRSHAAFSQPAKVKSFDVPARIETVTQFGWT